MKSKLELRKIIINNRKCKSKEIIELSSKKAVKSLISDRIFKKSRTIGIYFPIKNEIDITDLLNICSDKTFAVPVITKDDDMVYAEVTKNTKLIKKSFDILEPLEIIDITDQLDLIIIPSLSINSNNYRLGYGKGYFDKFLKKYPNLENIGIIYEDEQLDFNVEDHDLPLKKYIKG